MKLDHATQRAGIEEHLRQGLLLTPRDALHRFGCFRLAAHIHELRKAGWDITTEIQHPARYAAYYLNQAPR